jgi:Flp pilus assembly CpaE family ATPase
MCREPFDLPTYRCRLIIERVSDNQRATSNFETQSVQDIVEGFGLDFRALVPAGSGRMYTDIHFDVEPTEALEEILRELGLPEGPFRFG